MEFQVSLCYRVRPYIKMQNKGLGSGSVREAFAQQAQRSLSSISRAHIKTARLVISAATDTDEPSPLGEFKATVSKS